MYLIDLICIGDIEPANHLSIIVSFSCCDLFFFSQSTDHKKKKIYRGILNTTHLHSANYITNTRSFVWKKTGQNDVIWRSYILNDTVLIAEDEASLHLVTAVKDESEKCGLLMNIKKTKVMLLTKDTKEKKVSIHIDHKEVKQVQSFTYLGQPITDDGTLVSLSQMMVKAKEKSEVELVLLKMHSQRDMNF